MIAMLLCLFALHPGHMTRMEMRISDDSRCIETAMKMSATDLEAALKRRFGRSVRIETLSDEDAMKNIGDYLRSTILFQNDPLSKEQFKWIGWQKKATYVWVFFEIHTLEPEKPATQLQIRSLFEVEPEIQHVVVLADNAGDRTVILRESTSDITVLRSK